MAHGGQKSYSLRVATGFPRSGSGWERLQHFISIGGPIGFLPWVPATCASAVVAALCWWAPPNWGAVAAITLVLYLVGSATATTSERLLQTEDPRNVVIDELAGQLLSFLFVVPVNWKIAVAGFALFRVFDISKPFPARRAEYLPGGWGIMTDDLVAGLYAALVLYFIRGWLG